MIIHKYIITGDLEQSDLRKRVSGLEDAIKRFAGVTGVGLAQFKEKDDDILNFEEENQSNLVNKIKELNSLYDQGVLNKEEFERAKKKILWKIKKNSEI